MCLLAMEDGFVYGSDQFYYVYLDTIDERVLVDDGSFYHDWPVSALYIGAGEILLAYYSMHYSFYWRLHCKQPS